MTDGADRLGTEGLLRPARADARRRRVVRTPSCASVIADAEALHGGALSDDVALLLLSHEAVDDVSGYLSRERLTCATGRSGVDSRWCSPARRRSRSSRPSGGRRLVRATCLDARATCLVDRADPAAATAARCCSRRWSTRRPASAATRSARGRQLPRALPAGIAGGRAPRSSGSRGLLRRRAHRRASAPGRRRWRERRRAVADGVRRKPRSAASAVGPGEAIPPPSSKPVTSELRRGSVGRSAGSRSISRGARPSARDGPQRHDVGADRHARRRSRRSLFVVGIAGLGRIHRVDAPPARPPRGRHSPSSRAATSATSSRRTAHPR